MSNKLGIQSHVCIDKSALESELFGSITNEIYLIMCDEWQLAILVTSDPGARFTNRLRKIASYDENFTHRFYLI